MDYCGYTKNCPAKYDEVVLQVEPGTGKFSDKMVIKEFAAKQGQPKQPTGEAEKPVVNKKDMSDTKITPKFTVNESIERSVAFKGAIELVKETIAVRKDDNAVGSIPDVSQTFEKCLKILKGEYS